MNDIAQQMENPESDEELEKLMIQYGRLQDEHSNKGGYKLAENFSKI